MRIAIDAMGGDYAPESVVYGALEALKAFEEICVILVGDQDKINPLLNKASFSKERMEIIHASEVIEGDDKPVEAIRKKKDASLTVALNLLKEGKADACLSAGNTGALLAGGLFRIGRIKGVDRPALGGFLPTRIGGSLLLDIGANVDCKPRNLEEFAIMGSIYAKHVLKISSPKVALLNIGAEETKGNDLTLKTFPMLQKLQGIDFIGNIEPRDIPEGKADVVVCDGFTGNVVLKLTEGVAMTLMGMIKEVLLKNLQGKLGALLIKKNLSGLKKKFDYEEVGGAPLLGIDGIVIKGHGSSNAKAIFHAIRQAKLFHESGMLDILRENIAKREVESKEMEGMKEKSGKENESLL